MAVQNTVYYTDYLPSGYPVNGGTYTQFNLISTIGMLTVGKMARINDEYSLQEPLTAEVKWEDGKYVVVEYRVDEYGIGETLKEAQEDLLNSLVDYLSSLEKREKRLGDRERQNLQILRDILVKKLQNNGQS
jgi:hypothetical protein